MSAMNEPGFVGVGAGMRAGLCPTPIPSPGDSPFTSGMTPRARFPLVSMEQLANALSRKVKPLIIATSATSPLLNYGPSGHQGHGGWAPNPVGRGDFTVPDDRKALGGVIAKLIQKRKAQALQEGDMLWFRHLHCLAAGQLNGTGAENMAPRESLDEWMATMQFNSVRDGLNQKGGITPLRYAAIACRPDLVAALLERGADLP